MGGFVTMSDLLEIYDPAVLSACGGMLGEGLDPLPPLPLPQYRPAENRQWQFKICMLAAAPGYFRGPQVLMHPVAILYRDGISWMSTVPMEIESQMPHAAVSRGKVVICGLGLGVMAYAVAARRSVDKVVVVERDPDVVDLFYAYSGFAEWPQRNKIEIVLADAREFRCSDADFLYADIWPRYRMAEMLADMQAMHRGIPAPACGYWGQELDMLDWAVAQGIAPEDFGPDTVEAFGDAAHLPLIGAQIPGYGDLCRKAFANPLFQRPASGTPSALGGTERPKNPANNSTVNT